jgi:DnaK suppressor protein
VNVQQYKTRLEAIAQQIEARIRRETALGREQISDTSRDSADESVADESASEDFTSAELDSTVLQDVRDALKRIGEGTFGHCVVDGGPIEPKRLEAIPWTPYCLAHQAQIEASAPARMPTL